MAGIPCGSAGSAPYATVPVVDQQPECFTSLLSALQNYGDTQRFPCSKTVEKSSVPSERSPVGSVSSSQNYHDGRIPDGLEDSPSRTSSTGSLLGEQRSWHINRLELLIVFLALRQFLPQLTGYHFFQDGQHDGSFLSEPSRGITFSPLYRLVRSVLLRAQTKFLSVRAVYITGHLNSGADLLSRQRMENREWRLHPQVVNLIWQPLGLVSRSGCFGPRMAQNQSVRFSPYLAAPSNYTQSTIGQREAPAFRGSMVAYPVVVYGHGQSVNRASLGDSQGDSPHDLLTQARAGFMEAMGVSPKRNGVNMFWSTIINSRAPSMRHLYDFKWRLFALVVYTTVLWTQFTAPLVQCWSFFRVVFLKA